MLETLDHTITVHRPSAVHRPFYISICKHNMPEYDVIMRGYLFKAPNLSHEGSSFTGSYKKLVFKLFRAIARAQSSIRL